MRDITYGQDIVGVEWHKIRRLDSGCWEWTGKVRSNGQPAHVHRILLEAKTGKSFHKSRKLCDLPTCVHPDHREWYGKQEREPYWVCQVDNCVKPVSARGMCSMHETRVRRGLDPEPPEMRDFRKGVCTWASCTNPVRSNSLCSPHYRRNLLGLDMDSPIRARYGPRECSIPNCERALEAKGYCSVHYQRFKDNRPLNDPIPERQPDREVGDTYIGYEGYEFRVVLGESGRKEHVREHRRVMEDFLGRSLTPEETVHHINGVRHDNRLENLELWSSSHPPGQRVKDKVAWAKEILERYREFDTAH